jgi:NADH-quinone oxidoreductase subunit J
MRKRKDTKYLGPAQQIRVKRSERVRMVSMRAEPRDRATPTEEILKEEGRP